MKEKSLRAAVLTAVLAVVALGFAASVAVLTWHAGRSHQALAMQHAEQLAQAQSRQVAAEVEAALVSARSLAQALVAMKTAGQPSRGQADALQRRLLEENPEFLGVWTGWEPDAFDGADAAHAGQPGHDQTGRYVPYWNRGGGSTAVEPLLDYDKPGAGDYYLLPRQRGKETLIEPYLYKVAGKDTLITSVAVPISVDGRFVGVAGVDIALANIGQRLATIRPYETGHASLISHGGQYLGDVDPAQVGQPVKDLPPEAAAAIRQGQPLRLAGRDADGGAAVTELYVPVQLGRTGTPWSFRLTVPDDRVLAETHQLRWMAAGLGLAVLVLVSIGLAVLLDRLVLKPLGGEPAQAVALARRVAAGDLTTRISLPPGGERSLMAALHAMQEQLSQLVSNVRTSAEGVASASAQIAQGNADLSDRTEQQASALQQTAASMLQFTQDTTRSAEHAQAADTLAREASEVARQGSSAVDQMVATMQRIREGSQRITTIIGTIDGIAFQTNILALNAAVEAARAGESGRGFAVVASEVRTLAHRSAEAAREIKALIGDSEAQVSQGAALADQAGSTMGQVMASITRVTTLVGEISHTSRAQSQNVARISDAVSGVDEATQRNAALVEESSAAAQTLRHQAEGLVEAVAAFRV